MTNHSSLSKHRVLIYKRIHILIVEEPEQVLPPLPVFGFVQDQDLDFIPSPPVTVHIGQPLQTPFTYLKKNDTNE